MSTTLEQAQLVGNHLRQQAFFGRLAQHGVRPGNEKEAAALLQFSIDLESVDPAVLGKQAAARDPYGSGPFAQLRRKALTKLAAAEIAPGFPAAQFQPPAARPDDFLLQQAKTAAAHLLEDSTVLDAALTIRAALEAS
jgi:hypothetical protein